MRYNLVTGSFNQNRPFVTYATPSNARLLVRKSKNESFLSNGLGSNFLTSGPVPFLNFVGAGYVMSFPRARNLHYSVRGVGGVSTLVLNLYRLGVLRFVIYFTCHLESTALIQCSFDENEIDFDFAEVRYAADYYAGTTFYFSLAVNGSAFDENVTD